MVPLWLWVLGRRPLEGLCHPYCIISRVHTINIIVDLDITWLRSCCQISPLSSYFPSTFLCYTLWKEVTSCSPLRGELCSISLKAVYLYTLFGIILHGIFGLSLLSHFLKSIQSFIYITKDLWIFILYYIYIYVCVCVCVCVCVYWTSPVAQGERIHLQCRRHKFEPWVRKIPRGGNGNLFQYSCPGNPMDREAWWATVHGVKKSHSQLSN